MAEDKESGFRVTDRRKFNSDGTPRDNVDEAEVPASPAEPPAEAPPVPEAQSDNVVAFPGDAARRREESPPVEPPADAGTTAEPSPVGPRAAPPSPETRKAAASAAEQAYNQTRGPQSPNMPEASFLTLLDMFATEAAMNLGLAQTPDGNRTPVDLEAARHWIDMLGMLDQKTRGNLTDEEAGALEEILAVLRMQFVGALRKR